VRIVAAVLIVLCTAKPAAACIPIFERAIVKRPAFEPADAVTILGEDVDIQCDDRRECTIAWTFEVAVARTTRASVTGYHSTALAISVDGAVITGTEPGGSARDLAPSDKRFVVSAHVQLPEYIDGCFTDGVIARHPYLASKPKGDQRILQIDTTATPRVKHPSSWDLVVDTRGATKSDPATTRLWFDTPDRLVTHGGPFLLVGAISGDGGGFHARGGWEAAIGPSWLVFALAGETDFHEAWNVALTAEAMNRAWVLPLTFGAGGGVVLANGDDLGVRGQLSIALSAIRVLFSLHFRTQLGGGERFRSGGAFIGGGF